MAGLIPQSFIDDLLQRTDIVEVVSRRVPELKKKGRNHTACCPFHNEKTPSFSVNEQGQFFYCFGCGVGGNAIGFLMDYENMSFPEAVESLARDAGMEVPREESRADARRESENKSLLEALERASKFYQYQLRHHGSRKAAVDYLKQRGVSGEIARDFALGLAPPGWDNLLNAIGTDSEAEQALLKAGLIIQKEGKPGAQQDDKARQYYDRFRDRIVFPIRNARGQTIAFGGRVLGDDKPKYLNSPETPMFSKGSELYGLYEAKRARNRLEKVLIVEGYMDVIALAQMGVRNAVATLGTATSAKHLTRLFRLVGEVVFCFDGDEAGRTAAWRALEATLPLLEDGRQVRFLFLPEGTDPDSFIRQFGTEKFQQEVSAARPLEDFFFDKLTENLDMGSIEGRARLSNLAKPLLRKLPRGVYARLMVERLAEKLGLSREALDELLEEEEPASPEGYTGQDQPPPPPQSAPPLPAGYAAQVARKQGSKGQLSRFHKPAAVTAIELLLRNPEVALTLDKDLESLRQAEDEARKLLLSLIEMVRRDPHTETYTLLGYCYGTPLGGQLTQLLKGETITPPEGIEQEFKQIIDNILSDISRKRRLFELRGTLESVVSAAKDRN